MMRMMMTTFVFRITFQYCSVSGSPSSWLPFNKLCHMETVLQSTQKIFWNLKKNLNRYLMMCPDSLTTWWITYPFYLIFITLRAKLSGAVYCYRSCLFVCNGRAVSEPYYSQRARSVCFSLSAFFNYFAVYHGVKNDAFHMSLLCQ